MIGHDHSSVGGHAESAFSARMRSLRGLSQSPDLFGSECGIGSLDCTVGSEDLVTKFSPTNPNLQ